ncbi:MAG: hypothetical protein AAGG75_02460 [Bacteroidota bacterium]
MSVYKLFSGLLLCLLLLQGCGSDDDLPSFGEVKPVEINRAHFSALPFAGLGLHLILSSPEGNVLSCQSISGDTTIVIPDDILNTEGGYHLTLSSYYVNDFPVNGQLSDGISLITYTHLKIPELSFSFPGFTPPPFTTNSPAIWASLDAEQEDIEYFSISSSVYSISSYLPGRQRVYMADQTGDIMVLLKLKAEEEWRFAYFENLPAVTDLLIQPESLDKIPAKNIEIPAGFTVEWGQLLGITECEMPNKDFVLQSFAGAAPGALGSAALPNLFEQFSSNLILRDEDRSYQLTQLGEQLTEFLPSPINFSPGDRNVRNFELSSLSGFTVFRGEWSANPNNELRVHELHWQVWGEFPEIFRGPALPGCLTDQHDWLPLAESKLDLIRLAQYQNSTLENYSDFLEFRLSNERGNTSCRTFNLDGPGREEIRTKEY